MIEPTPAANRRRTSVYTIEFPGTEAALDRAVARAREITTVVGSGLYGPRSMYLRIRVADDALAAYVAQQVLSPWWTLKDVTIHTGLGPSRRVVQT